MKTTKLLAQFAFVLTSISLAIGAQAQTVLKFSHTDQQQGGRHAAAQIFAKKVADYTQNRYKVNVFCCSQLGSDPKNIEQLVAGGIDFTVSATGSYAPHIDSLNLTMLPFLFDSYEQGWKFYDESKWLKTQFDKAPAKGFRFLATWEAGFRCMTTKDVLNSPADAKGKKLRTFPNEMMRWLLEDVGFGVQIRDILEDHNFRERGGLLPNFCINLGNCHVQGGFQHRIIESGLGGVHLALGGKDLSLGRVNIRGAGLGKLVI